MAACRIAAGAEVAAASTGSGCAGGGGGGGTGSGCAGAVGGGGMGSGCTGAAGGRGTGSGCTGEAGGGGAGSGCAVCSRRLLQTTTAGEIILSLGGDTFPPDDEWKSTALPSNCVDGTATGANEDANRCVLRTTCDTAITEPFLRVALTTPATALTTIKVTTGGGNSRYYSPGLAIYAGTNDASFNGGGNVLCGTLPLESPLPIDTYVFTVDGSSGSGFGSDCGSIRIGVHHSIINTGTHPGSNTCPHPRTNPISITCSYCSSHPSSNICPNPSSHPSTHPGSNACPNSCAYTGTHLRSNSCPNPRSYPGSNACPNSCAYTGTNPHSNTCPNPSSHPCPNSCAYTGTNPHSNTCPNPSSHPCPNSCAYTGTNPHSNTCPNPSSHPCSHSCAYTSTHTRSNTCPTSTSQPRPNTCTNSTSYPRPNTCPNCGPHPSSDTFFNHRGTHNGSHTYANNPDSDTGTHLSGYHVSAAPSEPAAPSTASYFTPSRTCTTSATSSAPASATCPPLSTVQSAPKSKSSQTSSAPSQLTAPTQSSYCTTPMEASFFTTQSSGQSSSEPASTSTAKSTPTTAPAAPTCPSAPASPLLLGKQHPSSYDPELVESYQAWLAAGTSVERFPRLAAASLYVVNHTFGSLQDPTLLPGARPTVQLDVLLEFPDVDVVTLPEESLLRWAFATCEASTADIKLESATAVSLESATSRVHLRLLFVSPPGDVLSMQANRKAAAAFVAAVHAAATSKPAEDNGPFGSMAAALGRVRLLDDMSHEIFLLPDRQQVLDVVFEAKPDMEPTKDTQPPYLELAVGEDGERMERDGVDVMDFVIHHLVLPLPAGRFDDPGATAMDAMDGDLTSFIRVRLSSTEISTPTRSDAPIIITYTVFDSAGNKALAERHLYLGCRAAERVCDFGDGRRICSTEGVCMPVDFGALMDATPPPREPPTIALIGDPVVRLPRYSDYPVCSPNTPWARLCERGVTAEDALQGDLTELVVACPGMQRLRFAQYGVSSCGLDTSVPGRYVIKLEVTNDAGLSAAVSREVFVEDVCPSGERLCRNMLCSMDTICMDELLQELSSDGLLLDGALEELLGSGSSNVQLQGQLQLKGPRYETLRLHMPWRACSQALAGEPCDLGAVVMGPGGEEVIGHIILACPPSTCVAGLERCPEHIFAVKGVDGCLPPPEERQVGQTYAVTFIMVDWSSSAVEPQAVERYITIAPSCPLGEEMCAGGLCSPLPCSMLADLTAGQEEEAAEPLPVGTAIRLVGARSLKIRFGTPLPDGGLLLLPTCAHGLASVQQEQVAIVAATEQQGQLIVDVDITLHWIGDDHACGALLGTGKPSHVEAMMLEANEALQTAATSGRLMEELSGALQASDSGIDLDSLELTHLDDRSAGLDLHLHSVMAMVQLKSSRMLDMLARALAAIKAAASSLQQSEAGTTLQEAEFSLSFRALVVDALSSAVDSSLNAFEATGSFVFFKGEHLDELQEALAQFLGFLRKEMVPSYPELEPFLRRRAQGSGAGVPWWSSVGSSANDLLTSALLEGVAEESCRQSLQASYSFTAAFAEDKGDTAMDGGSSRRRLLAAGGGSSGGSGRSRGKGGNAERAMDSSQWKDKEILQTNAAVAAGGLNQEVPRYVGNANNRLVAGVLLHQTRRPPRVLPYMCSAHEERFHGLTKMCTTMEIVLANLPEGEVMRYAEDFAHPLAPYGSDPVLRPASALFSAAARADDYYNMSRESGEVSGYGAARWFFPRQVAGLADGFPLVLETRMSRRRASEAWYGLDEAALIDDKTAGLSFRFAIFNTKASSVGSAKVTFFQAQSGLLSSVLEVQEAVLAAHLLGPAKLFVAEAVVTLGLCCLKLKDITQSPQSLPVRLALFTCLVAVLAMHLLCIFRGLQLNFEPSYDIYDAAPSGVARWWMPFKANATTAGSADTYVPRGAPGRWKLPDDNTGLNAFGGALLDVEALILSSTLWHFLQLVAVLLLLFHWLQLASVNPSIERIRATIVSARSDLCHFFVLMAILMVLAAFACHIGLGSHLRSVSSVQDAVRTMFRLMVSSDLGGINQLAKSQEVYLSLMESVMAHLLLFLLPTLFIFVMLNFLLAILGLRWAEQLEVRDSKLKAQQYQSYYGHPLADVLLNYTDNLRGAAEELVNRIQRRLLRAPQHRRTISLGGRPLHHKLQRTIAYVVRVGEEKQRRRQGAVAHAAGGFMVALRRSTSSVMTATPHGAASQRQALAGLLGFVRAGRVVRLPQKEAAAKQADGDSDTARLVAALAYLQTHGFGERDSIGASRQSQGGPGPTAIDLHQAVLTGPGPNDLRNLIVATHGARLAVEGISRHIAAMAAEQEAMADELARMSQLWCWSSPPLPCHGHIFDSARACHSGAEPRRDAASNEELSPASLGTHNDSVPVIPCSRVHALLRDNHDSSNTAEVAASPDTSVEPRSPRGSSPLPHVPPEGVVSVLWAAQSKTGIAPAESMAAIDDLPQLPSTEGIRPTSFSEDLVTGPMFTRRHNAQAETGPPSPPPAPHVPMALQAVSASQPCEASQEPTAPGTRKEGAYAVSSPIPDAAQAERRQSSTPQACQHEGDNPEELWDEGSSDLPELPSVAASPTPPETGAEQAPAAVLHPCIKSTSMLARAPAAYAERDSEHVAAAQSVAHQTMRGRSATVPGLPELPELGGADVKPPPDPAAPSARPAWAQPADADKRTEAATKRCPKITSSAPRG
eukprot:jgi/Tetstr1/431773/TSEL_021272.t3